MSTEQSTERGEPRTMLALITLATDLPVPTGVTFHVYEDGHGILSLDFRRVSDGQAWSRHLGGETDTYVNEDGCRYLHGGLIKWHGWSVQIHASEPIQPDGALDAETTDRLKTIVVDFDDCAREVAAALQTSQQ